MTAMRAILLTLACLLPTSAGADHEHRFQPTEEWEWERCAKGWRHRVCHQDRCACSATRGYKCGAWSACDLAAGAMPKNSAPLLFAECGGEAKYATSCCLAKNADGECIRWGSKDCTATWCGSRLTNVKCGVCK